MIIEALSGVANSSDSTVCRLPVFVLDEMEFKVVTTIQEQLQQLVDPQTLEELLDETSFKKRKAAPKEAKEKKAATSSSPQKVEDRPALRKPSPQKVEDRPALRKSSPQAVAESRGVSGAASSLSRATEARSES